MGRVLVAGGTGLIGWALAAELARIKHEMIVLSRKLAEVLLLGGQRVLPECLQEAGYRFRYREALEDLLEARS